jgi:tryptophanyl-tRNA synthetase
MVEYLTPIRTRYLELIADPGELERILGMGADRAAEVADETLKRAVAQTGLLLR